jgi:NADH-quinone oxidoreductase subunit C
MDAEQILAIIAEEQFPGVISTSVELGDAVVILDSKKIAEFFSQAKQSSGLKIDLLLSITAVDWLDAREQRFEIVYHARSLATGAFFRVKAAVNEDEPTVPSLHELWHSSLFMEREVWDMYGIKFEGHPDLRRVLMYEEFEGYPLRKDYPVQGKQPRIALRSPEVRNTAMDMRRGALMKIGRVNS